MKLLVYNFRKMSDEKLNEREKALRYNIAEHQKNLETIKSKIFTMWTNYWLKKCFEELSCLECEKRNRRLNNK